MPPRRPPCRSPIRLVLAALFALASCSRPPSVPTASTRPAAAVAKPLLSENPFIALANSLANNPPPPCSFALPHPAGDQQWTFGRPAVLSDYQIEHGGYRPEIQDQIEADEAFRSKRIVQLIATQRTDRMDLDGVYALWQQRLGGVIEPKEIAAARWALEGARIERLKHRANSAPADADSGRFETRARIMGLPDAPTCRVILELYWLSPHDAWLAWKEYQALSGPQPAPPNAYAILADSLARRLPPLPGEKWSLGPDDAAAAAQIRGPAPAKSDPALAALQRRSFAYMSLPRGGRGPSAVEVWRGRMAPVATAFDPHLFAACDLAMDMLAGDPGLDGDEPVIARQKSDNFDVVVGIDRALVEIKLYWLDAAAGQASWRVYQGLDAPARPAPVVPRLRPQEGYSPPAPPPPPVAPDPPEPSTPLPPP